MKTLLLLIITLTRGDSSSVHDHYVDDHCEGHFQVETNTIIRTEDSINMGGAFLNETQVLSLSRCLHYCCSYPLCNTAVFDERMDSSEGGSCYLFDCGSLDDLKCQFTTNPDFSAAVLDIDRHKFDISADDQRQGHSSQLELLRSRDGMDQVAQCSQYQFQCRSGECIATYDTCNGIPQCTDASDEDPGLCPPQTTSSPAGHLHLRPDMDPPQQQRQQQQQSYWSQQQLPSFQDNRASVPGQGNMADYFYPANQGNPGNNVINSQRGPGSLGPDFVYQYPSRTGYQQYPGQYQQPMNYPQPQPQLPYQMYPQQPLPPLQQQPQMNQAQVTKKVTVTKTPTSSSTTQKTTTKRKPITTTTTTMSPEEKFEADLIAELGDELTSMELPGVAIFTLTMGILLTCLLCVLVMCRIKQGKMGFRRGLAHDADGDFLVNGMYL